MEKVSRIKTISVEWVAQRAICCCWMPRFRCQWWNDTAQLWRGSNFEAMPLCLSLLALYVCMFFFNFLYAFRPHFVFFPCLYRWIQCRLVMQNAYCMYKRNRGFGSTWKPAQCSAHCVNLTWWNSATKCNSLSCNWICLICNIHFVVCWALV